MAWPLNFRTLSLAGVILSLLTVASARAQDPQQEMVDNPHYQYWHNYKPGATVVHEERTKAADSESSQGPDEKRITYKLLEANDKEVVVEMVVTEKEPLGYIQEAPTRYILPAKVSRQDLERQMQMTGAKTGEEVLKVQGRELKVRTMTGTIKEPDGTEKQYKVWLSDDVPGAIVKKVQTTRQNGAVVAETTIALLSYKNAD